MFYKTQISIKSQSVAMMIGAANGHYVKLNVFILFTDSSPNLRAAPAEVTTLMGNSNTNLLIQRVVDYSDLQTAGTTAYA